MRDTIGPHASERGFTILETLVGLAIAGFTLLAVVALHGFQPPEHRVAAMTLQAALAETRALAESNAATTNGTPTGATLTVVPLANGSTRIAVFAARPIPGAPPLLADNGFPPVVLPVSITVPGLTVTGEPFTILVASSGYASVAANYAYDPTHPRALSTDPGCDEANGVTIAIADDSASETHAFECRGAQYDATATPPAKRVPQ